MEYHGMAKADDILCRAVSEVTQGARTQRTTRPDSTYRLSREGRRVQEEGKTMEIRRTAQSKRIGDQLAVRCSAAVSNLLYNHRCDSVRRAPRVEGVHGTSGGFYRYSH